MSKTITLEKAINDVYEFSANNYDEVVPVLDMEFDSLKSMSISGRQFGILPSAQRLLANRLRLPYSGSVAKNPDA